MKKIVSAILLIATTSLLAQNKDLEPRKKRHELKFNAFNTLVFKSPSGSYEFLIDDDSSIGISAMVNLENDRYDDDEFIDVRPIYNENYTITPYYRRYFSSKPSWGFFIEAFAMFNEQEDRVLVPTLRNVNGNVYSEYEVQTSNNFAMGMSVGGKFVTRKGFSFEFFGGLGRNLSTSNEKAATEAVPRLGILFGYRF